MAPEWLERVRRTLLRWRASGLGDGWVVAVSGGSDSVGLLRALHVLAPAVSVRLSVAHLDHSVRGEAARADAAFVAELAAALGLPFDLGRWQPSRVGHFEVDARRARYAWLAEVARARGASVVAVGHTRDDQAETILHRIVRGTGPRGLTGMPARRCLDAVGDSALTLVRPLLGAGRSEVRAWLDALGQPFRDDASNADLSRTRARIRHDLLPKLASDYNPRVALALVRLGALAAESQSALRGWLERVSREATVEATSGVLVFLNARLARLPRAVRVEALRLAWQRAGWPERDMNTARWRRLAAMVRPAHNRDPGRFSLGAGVEVWLSTDLLRLTRAHHELGVVDLRPAPVRLPVPGAAIWGAGRVVATLDPAEPRDETVDLDALGPELWVRAPAAGDRFGPLGMEGRTMPLSDFLRGRKVGRAERGRVPLVCDGPGIVWVAGHRIADRVRMREATARALGLRWEPGPVWRGSRGAVSPPPQPSPTTGGGS